MPKDPLDQKIDALLASQPLEPSDDFAARTLAKAEAEPQRKQPGSAAPLIRFALPLAAAVALALLILSQFRDAPSPAGPDHTAAAPGAELNHYEIQEILLLQEGLSGIAQSDDAAADTFNGSDLLHTLETLYTI